MKDGIEIIREATDNRLVKYYINEKKKTVVCVIEESLPLDEDEHFCYFKDIVSRGKAKCMPEDKFNKELGMRVARDRADIGYHKILRNTFVNDMDKGVKAFNRFMINVNKEISKQDSKISNITVHLNKLLEETE